jgi:uncharacterized protein
MIIDCHCHAGRGEALSGPWDASADLGLYLRRADRAGIDRTVLFSVFSTDYAEANRVVGRIAARRPDRFLGFAFVHASRDRGRIASMVGEAVGEWGMCGIKVHRYDAPISREVCEAARAYSLPVLYDPMGEVAVAELLAAEYPDVAFIIPHLGSFADDWKAQTAFTDHLARHPNIYTDTSGIRRFDLLKEAVRRASPRKVLFGSDGPWLHPGLELHKVRLLGLAPADEALILGGNLRRLLGPAGRSVSPRGRARRRPRGVPVQVRSDVTADPWVTEDAAPA